MKLGEDRVGRGVFRKKKVWPCMQHMLTVPALERQNQGNSQAKTSLSYTSSSDSVPQRQGLGV